MYEKLEALYEERDRLYEEANTTVKAAQEAERDLSEDEQATIDAHLDRIETTLNPEIKRLERLESMRPGEREPAEQTTRQQIRAHDRREDDPTFGFGQFSSYLSAVRQACMPGGSRDERLNIGSAAATTFGSEGSGADGGFAVPPQFSAEIRALMLGEDSFFAMTSPIPVQGNSLTFPADETTPWGGGGVTMSWVSEGTAGSQQKPSLKLKELRLKKLLGLVPLTDELVEDASALGPYVLNQLGMSARWELNNAMVNGTGAGQPMGIANAGAKEQVTRDTSSTVKAIDVATMYSRLLPFSTRNAVWLIHPDVFPQLITMTISDQPVFVMPGSGITTAPGGMLLGRPVILTQTAETLGTAGDVRLVDWSQYVTIEKSGGIQTAQSMHLFFDADQTAFRATFRADGQPWLSAAVGQRKGSNKLTTIVELN